MTDTEWLTRTQAAEQIGVSKRAFDRYAQNGVIRKYRTPGNKPRYKASDVANLIRPAKRTES